jgi:hypothetical protein
MQVSNGSAIVNSAAPVSFNPNQILFDSDVTEYGSRGGLYSSNSASFIDNYGTIIRSNPGSYKALPIKNENNPNYPSLLDLQSSLTIQQWSTNTGTIYSLDQEAGKTILENGSTLTVGSGVLVNGGELLTYGSAQATIQPNAPSGFPTLTFEAGTLTIQADNPGGGGQYGSLSVLGNMSWTGGTFEAYVNGGTAGSQTQLIVQGTLSLGLGADLNINVIGNLTSSLTWTPVTATTLQGTLTFDSGASFVISYVRNANPNRIDVRSR